MRSDHGEQRMEYALGLDRTITGGELLNRLGFPPLRQPLAEYDDARHSYVAWRSLWFAIGQACAYLEASHEDECTPMRNKLLAILREHYTLCAERWAREKLKRDELAERV